MFAIGQILAHERKRHLARVVHRFFPSTPLRKISERSLGGELVVFRKTALDREEADERVDRLLHLGEACAKGQALAIERFIDRQPSLPC